MGFDLPEPALVHTRLGLLLRVWRPADANALAEAWADPIIAARCAVPGEAGLDRARRWIAGEEQRRAAGSALDLVVAGAGDEVWGEVGLRPLVGPRRVLEVGWWVDATHRGLGVAAWAVTAVADWSVDHLDVDHLVARIGPDHPAATRVATRAGFVHRGRLDAGQDLWARAMR